MAAAAAAAAVAYMPAETHQVDSSDLEAEKAEVPAPRFFHRAQLAVAVTCVVAVAWAGGVRYGAHLQVGPATTEASICPAMADCSGFPSGAHRPGAGHLHPSSPHDFVMLQGDIPPGAAGVLVQSYHDVFKTGNRNSAGHLWASFILKQSEVQKAADLEDLFTGFCGVSGSVVIPISADSRWRVTLKDLAGAEHKGFMYYCTGCMGWPCLCDAREHIKVDTKTITLAGGEQKQYKFAVIGNPCKEPTMAQRLSAVIDDPEYRAQNVTLQMSAPELTCEGSALKGATLSDNGHVILSMFHEDNQQLGAQDEHKFDEMCTNRGAGAGMGPIFRTFAGINPL